MMLWLSVPEEPLRVRSVAKLVTGIRLAVATLLMAPVMVHAAGLGRLTVNSPLGQPLNAEIEIVSLQSGEEDSLQARLGTLDTFRQADTTMRGLTEDEFLRGKERVRRAVRAAGDATSPEVRSNWLDLLVLR